MMETASWTFLCFPFSVNVLLFYVLFTFLTNNLFNQSISEYVVSPLMVGVVFRSASASSRWGGVRRLHVELEGERLSDSAGATVSSDEQPLH